METLRAVVLGGSGFIGTNLLQRLCTAGCQATCCSRSSHRFRAPIAGVKYLSVDLTTQPDLRSILEGADLVFHLASTSVPGTAEGEPGVELQDDIGWNLNILKQCVQMRVGRVVFVSSGGTVYGLPKATPIPETHPTEPTCFHGVGKLAVEKYLGVLRRHGLDSVVVRPANVYGPEQDFRGRVGLIAVALHHALAGEELIVWGDGSVVRDYIYVDDVCDGLIRVALAPVQQHVYNLGAGVGVSIRSLLEMIAAVSTRTLRVRYGPSRPMDVPANVLAIDRLKDEVGWAPRVGLRDGLERTRDWLQAVNDENSPLLPATGAQHLPHVAGARP